MTKIPDTYKTLLKPSPETLFKEKKSKFYGYAFPVRSEEEVKPILDRLKKKHHTANHVCYAWQIGIGEIRYRANDDGEPNNSAGMPIYGQIQSYELTNVLVAVARIFGGTKLGVGGLISAYRESAKMALEASKIVKRTTRLHYRLDFEYAEMNVVMANIKRSRLEISSQEMGAACSIILSVAKKNESKMLDSFLSLHKVKVTKLN
ncbi:IMPACT family protein [Maribacter algicola]|uniref:IMPACT family protein n=1 Tax=Meishania litoralis TaxID=3434685 RepID=A0ACC7LMH6_9FLAO